MIMKMFLLLLTLVLPWTIQERVLADSGQGRITINLRDLETPKNNVAFNVYKVGTWDGTTGNWQLAESLQDCGVVLEELVYASEWDAAAVTLSKQTGLETLLSVSGKTDENGTLTLKELEWGMYLVVQDGESEYGMVSPFLATLPYNEDGVQKSDLTVQPKAEPPLEEGKGKIVVTKRVGILDPELLEVVDIVLQDDVSYYVGLFKDAQGKVPYGTDYIKEIPMKDIRQGSVTFENLPAGTYYVFETDKDGNAYQLNEKQTDRGNIWICRLDETDNQEVIIEDENDSRENIVGFYNQYYEIHDHYKYVGTLSISKQVKDGEKEITVPETFYAGVFTDKGCSNLYKVVKLRQNGTVTLDVMLSGENGDEEISYYVYETDAEGNRLDKDSFGYIISGEGKADIRNGKWKAEVSLVNTKKTADKEKTDKSDAVRTGDDTLIVGYIVILLAAAMIMIAGIAYWRGHKKHE